MAEGPSLPVPAQGDIYAHDGKLSITNAAANVFVVYGRQPQDASHPSSSLSVDFVMGNIYLIDSVYFPPFQCSSTRHFGSLIKGFGLDFDGYRRGDTKIKTVYDDVVCVVGNQPGASCSIGTVAGNLVTVSDLSRLLTRPKPSNVAVSYVHGMTLHESHFAYGGGLHRALSTWASMAFPPASRGPSQTSPTKAVTLVKEGQDPKSNGNSTIWEEKKRGRPGQQNTVNGTVNLKKAINDREEAWQKIMDVKKQTAAAVREADLRNLGLLSLVQDLGPATTFDDAQSLVNPPRICGTIYEGGRSCGLCPGSQTIRPNPGGSVAKRKMARLGIKTSPATQSKPSKKQKRKQARSRMGGNSFATGANCTILQRPLPAAPPVRGGIPSVKIKREDED
ncbi:hypothetical protein QIS74_07932 [Colletotrichum tabaci]|uniref:Uncharacterized protein n=1 Tax=Colletotrichum tabaci TaxID=1209068 RepID=A0AAV9T6J0_9PEZI